MRVAKKCRKCTKLKQRVDFPVDNSHEGRGPYCNDCCFQHPELKELVNNNNNLIFETMPTLKEKREAEAAAKAAGQTTAAPVAEATKPVTDKTAPVKPAAKVGEKTPKGDTVVGEAKVPGQRGRKAAEEKVIEQLDMEGNPTGVTFATLQEAADAVGKNKAYVLDGLRGWAKSVAGFKWRYLGEEIFVREKKVKTPAEKEFVEKGKGKTAKVEDIPVPGDLDYDAELHAPKVEEEEEVLDPADEAVFVDETEVAETEESDEETAE